MSFWDKNIAKGVGKAAASAAKGAAAVGKGAAAGVGVKSAAVATAFAARRVTTPVIVVGGAFGAAAWFGAFELWYSAARLALPPPRKPCPNAELRGYASVPLTAGVSLWLGARLVEWPQPPASLFDLGGWGVYGRALPLRRCAAVAAASAGLSAFACRAIQHRSGG